MPPAPPSSVMKRSTCSRFRWIRSTRSSLLTAASCPSSDQEPNRRAIKRQQPEGMHGEQQKTLHGWQGGATLGSPNGAYPLFRGWAPWRSKPGCRAPVTVPLLIASSVVAQLSHASAQRTSVRYRPVSAATRGWRHAVSIKRGRLPRRRVHGPCIDVHGRASYLRARRYREAGTKRSVSRPWGLPANDPRHHRTCLPTATVGARTVRGIYPYLGRKADDNGHPL